MIGGIVARLFILLSVGASHDIHSAITLVKNGMLHCVHIVNSIPVL